MARWEYLGQYDIWVSDNGKIVGKKGFILKPYVRNKKTGYLAVKINKHNVYIHDLVTLAFIGPKPKGLEVRHLDDNRVNNIIDNLRYGTRKDNHDDCVRNGHAVNPPRFVGEDHPASKLTNKQTRQIQELYKTGKYTQWDIANKYGVHQATISSIILGKRAICK